MSEKEQEFIDKIQEDSEKFRKFVGRVTKIGSSLLIALLIGFGSLGAAFNNYIIKHEAEISGFKEKMDTKVDNSVVLEYIKYNDRMMKLVLEGVEKNSDKIEELKKEIKEFELKYFVQNTKRGGYSDECLYIPNLHWFVCGDDALYESLQIAYKSKIGLY